jgi:hypothetical protein
LGGQVGAEAEQFNLVVAAKAVGGEVNQRDERWRVR